MQNAELNPESEIEDPKSKIQMIHPPFTASFVKLSNQLLINSILDIDNIEIINLQFIKKEEYIKPQSALATLCVLCGKVFCSI